MRQELAKRVVASPLASFATFPTRSGTPDQPLDVASTVDLHVSKTSEIDSETVYGSLREHCSREAIEEMREPGVVLLVHEVVNEVKRQHPAWGVFCYVSRSPDDPGNRVVVRVETDIEDFNERLEQWEQLRTFMIRRSRSLEERFPQIDADEARSRFSVILW